MVPAQKELKEIERDKTSGVTVKLVGANLQRLTGFVQGEVPTCLQQYYMGVAQASWRHRRRCKCNAHTCHTYFAGPRDTPYEGGIFVVDIELGELKCHCTPSAMMQIGGLFNQAEPVAAPRGCRQPVPLRGAEDAVQDESVVSSLLCCFARDSLSRRHSVALTACLCALEQYCANTRCIGVFDLC